MKVIVEKAEPFYAVRPDIYYAGFFKGVSSSNRVEQRSQGKSMKDCNAHSTSCHHQ
jgi:hypothetical protein